MRISVMTYKVSKQFRKEAKKLLQKYPEKRRTMGKYIVVHRANKFYKEYRALKQKYGYPC